jgi:hypothetical protein
VPTINNIKISDAEFTAMQELATAWILKRAFQYNIKFKSEEDIVRDAPTLKGLQNIFKYNQKQLFIFKTPIVQKTPEAKWLNTFYLQQKKLLEEFSDASFTVFNREGGFMQFITDLIKDKFGIARKDSWNPADIWLIKEKNVFRKKIIKACSGASGTQTIAELNTMMRSMFVNREVVGISLKLISGKEAKYEEINVSDSFFKKLEMPKDNYNYTLSRIVIKLNLNKDSFATQDTNIFLKNTDNKEIAKFQIKGNTTSRLANLKFEGTEIGASAARLGKAPLNLVEKLSATKGYDSNLYNVETKKNGNYPTTLKQFQSVQSDYEKMFKRVVASKLVKDVGITDRNISPPKSSNVDMGPGPMSEFVYNMSTVFSSSSSHIANVKLMQLYFVDRLLMLEPDKQDEYLTDLLFIAQKKGNKVFDFGPFGKLY